MQFTSLFDRKNNNIIMHVALIKKNINLLVDKGIDKYINITYKKRIRSKNVKKTYNNT